MSKSAVKEVMDMHAHDQAASVLYHIETMYPKVFAAMSMSCRRSVRNTIKSTFKVHAEYVRKEAHSEGLTVGAILAASIAVKAHGEEVVAQEILGACGIDTRDAAVAAGADAYDLKILRPVFDHMKS